MKRGCLYLSGNKRIGQILAHSAPDTSISWPTLCLVVAFYVVWGAVLFAPMPTVIAVPILAVLITLHSSLQHEVIHGHPTPWVWVNQALVWPAVGLFVPFVRFRDSHLAHHNDARLTDPYDDPESNYIDPAVWARTSYWLRIILRANNTLVGRLVLGPIVGHLMWVLSDLRGHSRGVIVGWLAHIPAAGFVIWIVNFSGFSFGAYFFAAYGGLSLLKLRTFLEHQAHDRASGRTVIIEDRGPLAFLFLNNNLHVVHHMHPQVAWFALPRVYAKNKDHYLACNGGYTYASYGEVFRRFALRAKDPVAHPLWQKE